MGIEVKASPSTATLPSLAAQTIAERWIALQPRPANYRVAPGEVESLSRDALDALLTRQFRTGKSPPDEVYQQLLERVRRRVAKSQPIYVTIGYSPLKNPNTVSVSKADWAEFFALCHLAAWHNKIQAAYPAGIRMKIVFDDSTLTMANRVNRGAMDSYIGSIRSLVKAMGYESLIAGTLRQSSFAWIFHFGFYQLARRRVRYWDADSANAEQLRHMNEYAGRNVPVPEDLVGDERQRYVEEACRRYRVYWEALQMLGVTRSKSRIVAMYLDGTQHHIRDPLALHLTTVAKGQITQPWQGDGVLLDNGHGTLVPYVMTINRRKSHTSQTVRLPDPPLPGFEQVSVVRPVAGLPVASE